MTLRSLTSGILSILLISSGQMSIVIALETPVAGRPQSYAEYQSESDKYCESDERTWAKDRSLVGKIDYSEFDARAVNATLSKWRNNPDTSSEEKIRIKQGLDPVRIGEYSGFKTLEIARIGYRTRMNTLFSCAVIASRIDSMDGLTRIIESRVKTPRSETLDKIKKEAIALKAKLNTLKCNIPTATSSEAKGEIISILINTASYQYCGYRHYLSYLDSQADDVLRLQREEQGIGQGAGTSGARTTAEWVAGSTRYKSDISREIIRADTTLPKAIRTFIEMDQTYGAHILLMFIYDDYVRLRKALSGYMNLSSQLYQKANNAQSTNK